MDTDLILKNVSRHIALDESEVGYFLSLLKRRTIKRKEFLLRSGEVCLYENFVTRGCLRTYRIDHAGMEHIAMFAIEDWWTGDLYSFLTQKPTQFSIDALEESEVLQIDKGNLNALYKRVPKFERFFRIMLQNAFVAQQQRIMENLSFTVGERYLQFRKKYPQVEQRVPQKQIAAFLGITPEFLSMLRKKMAKGRIS